MIYWEFGGISRAAAFAQHVVILDEPTAALGVKEGNMVLELIRRSKRILRRTWWRGRSALIPVLFRRASW